VCVCVCVVKEFRTPRNIKKEKRAEEDEKKEPKEPNSLCHRPPLLIPPKSHVCHPVIDHETRKQQKRLDGRIRPPWVVSQVCNVSAKLRRASRVIHKRSMVFASLLFMSISMRNYAEQNTSSCRFFKFDSQWCTKVARPMMPAGLLRSLSYRSSPRRRTGT
jgi:hypothetical protein